MRNLNQKTQTLQGMTFSLQDINDILHFMLVRSDPEIANEYLTKYYNMLELSIEKTMGQEGPTTI